ncbi:MAG: toxic anion resistance protein [Methylococcaceae bacterium]|jgi:uncharacterized protein YaaN involved in tellurite resistance
MTISSTPIELSPPESLTPPPPVTVIAPENAATMVKLEPGKISELNRKVDDFVDAILREQVDSDVFKARVSGVHTLGNDDIRAAANISNRLLEQPVRAMNAGLFDEGSTISKSLIDLRLKIEELDPSKRGDMLQPRKILGLIPWGSTIADYFRQYQSAQTHLDAIIKSLYSGQDELWKDNAAVEEEKVNAWHIMDRLEQYVYIGRKIDAAIVEKLAEIEAADPEKAHVIKDELLFYVRQKVQDLLTQLAVTIQGYLAMDMVRKNNLELIKGIDRATTTTVSALRTAVIVAQALANQKLVLDQIGALNSTTSNLIESTSSMMKNQAGKIHEQASSAAVSLDKLQLAFQNIYDSVDMVANYKTQTLDNMHQTVTALSLEVDKSRRYLDRVRSEQVSDLRQSLLSESEANLLGL